MTSHMPALRRLALAGGVAIAAGAALAPSAAADVSISPAEAEQGGAASVAFEVRNQRAGAHTVKVEVDLPRDRPVAEVYPMSVSDWAPQIIQRPVREGLPGIHGSGLTSATSAVIWTRVPAAAPPPAVEELRLEMGPMPAVRTFVFTVVQTYSDGTVQRWQGPSPASAGRPPGAGTVLTLTPAGAGPGVQAHGGHQAGVSQASPQREAQRAAAVSAPPAPIAAAPVAGGSGTTFAIAGVVGVVITLVGLVMLAAKPQRERPQHESRGEPQRVVDDQTADAAPSRPA